MKQELHFSTWGCFGTTRDHLATRGTKDKTATIKTDLHYSDPHARDERTVFGEAEKGLFYNYNDRLYGDDWRRGEIRAKNEGVKPRTAAWFETCLKEFHGTEQLDLKHIILGCNMSNGYPYLIFGYNYTMPPKDDAN